MTWTPGVTTGATMASEFNAAESKLAGIDVGATANATDANLRDRATHTGTQTLATISDAGTAAAAQTGDFASAAQGALADSAQQPPTEGAFIDGDKTKLDSVASGATANATDADLRDRATHTGAQAIATVTGLQAELDGKVSSDPTGITGADAVTNIVSLTQAEYDAIVTPDAATFYVVV